MAYTCNLSVDLVNRARVEINEDPARRQEDIEHIREWIKMQPHLNARTDDWTILRFLRGCKFSLERTKEKMDMYYSLRTALPDWFTNRDPAQVDVQDILKKGSFIPLPEYDHMGRLIIIVRPGIHDPNLHSMDTTFKCNYIAGDVIFDEDEQHTITGLTQIIDLAHITPTHILQMTPSLIKKAMTIFQEGYPLRPKALHYINTPSTFESIFSIFRTFMKEKIRKRVHLHGNDMESLYKHVHKSALPKEYGGTCGNMSDLTDAWVKRVMARRNWLMEDEKFKVDEGKRIGKPKTSTEFFGLEGSFRKLNVD